MKATKTRKTLVDPRNTRGNKNYNMVMKEIVSQDVCPLCPRTMKWHTKPILKYDRGWFITENFSPYKNAKHHFLIISNRHKEELPQLSVRDWSSALRLIDWATKKFHMKGGGIILRFGNTLYTGATIKHLHFHLISPIVKNGKTLPVYFPIG